MKKQKKGEGKKRRKWKQINPVANRGEKGKKSKIGEPNAARRRGRNRQKEHRKIKGKDQKIRGERCGGKINKRIRNADWVARVSKSRQEARAQSSSRMGSTRVLDSGCCVWSWICEGRNFTVKKKN